jgi:hypothetical protein
MQGKCKIRKFLFVLLDKIKIFAFLTVYFSYQCLQMLCVHLMYCNNQNSVEKHMQVSVLDLVSQVRDVILVMCTFCSGKPKGAGILERGVYGEGGGNGEISLRATWDRGG